MKTWNQYTGNGGGESRGNKRQRGETEYGGKNNEAGVTVEEGVIHRLRQLERKTTTGIEILLSNPLNYVCTGCRL